MLSFVDAVKTCVVRKPLNFRDRAPRSEFWWFMLALFICSIIANIIVLIPILGALIYLVYAVGSFVLTISVSVRRLHDLNRTGWWIAAPYGAAILGGVLILAALAAESEGLASLGLIVCGLGGILCLVLLVFYFMPGTKGPNRFGPDPLAAAPAQPQPRVQLPGADGDFTKFGK